jgi:arginyl-tRNA synthetase
MKVKLASSVLQQFPGLDIIILLVKNINNSRKSSTVSQLLRGSSAVTRNDFKKVQPKDTFNQIFAPSLEEGSTLLETYLLSSRIKKIINGKDLEGNNNFYNLAHYLSLKMMLPLFGFDLDQAEKDYTIDLYEPKKGKKAPDFDFQPQTKHLVLWFPNLAQYDETQLQRKITEIESTLSRYANTHLAEVFHLNAQETEIDLDYISEKEQEYQQKQAEEEAQKAATQSPEPNSPSTEATPFDYATLPGSIIIKDQLKSALQQALTNAFPDFTPTPDQLEIETPKDPAHGDYASSTALKISKSLGQSPLEIANKIKDNFPSAENLQEITILGPGFINFRLTPAYFQQQLQSIFDQRAHFGHLNLGQNQQIMIEYGSLNIAKPFGAHHFLTTILGQTLVNLHRSVGYKVIAADYPGDWGTQFGKLLYAYKNWSTPEEVKHDPISELLKLYIRFHEEEEKNPALEAEGRAEFKKLEEGDSQNLEIWHWIKEVSLKEIDTIFKTLGVHHDWRHAESEFVQPAKQLLEKGKAAGKIIEGEKGAFIINLEEQNLPPSIVQKSDGSTLYATRDLASIQQRTQEFPELKRLIYVVDVAQTLHFNQLFASAKLLNLAEIDFKHVVYGRMHLPDSTMSTRKGTVVLGKDLIKEALQRAQTLVNEKSLDLSENERKQVASSLAISAIKYALICQAPESDFTFEWDKVLSFDGNSAPYLQYSQARANSILKKAAAEKDAPQSDQTTLFSINEDKRALEEESLTPYGLDLEQKLLKQLIRLPEAVEAAVNNYKPNLLTNYLFELAQTFNSFYSAIPVLKTKRPEILSARLELVEATSIVLKNGLNILGLSSFDRM